jgi:hypothetical protein
MEAVRTSETSVLFYKTTWCNNPEGCYFHTRRHENLKYHFLEVIYRLLSSYILVLRTFRSITFKIRYICNSCPCSPLSTTPWRYLEDGGTTPLVLHLGTGRRWSKFRNQQFYCRVNSPGTRLLRVRPWPKTDLHMMANRWSLPVSGVELRSSCPIVHHY